MQPISMERALSPAALTDCCIFYPAPCTKFREAAPAGKRDFTVEFLLSKPPPERAACTEHSLQPYPCVPLPACCPALCQSPGYYPAPWHNCFAMYRADWRFSPAPLVCPSPVREVKLKRYRAIFTQEQLAVLEREFKKNRYIVGPQRVTLAAAVGLTVLQVKVWFQNRRIKWKRDTEKCQTGRAVCEEGDVEDSQDGH
ncbi:homeobox protein notochord-like [Hemiscyllium ocellatum]|uniref:homeobox protein notochord-like n=1 Tax=Hemiscyllium ocellatum TaxID=170820 RepID=UPI002965D4EB|nr:homeobox protein notochord-like [Hemiscyllium ocellatum]